VTVPPKFHQIWLGDSRVECAKFKPGRVQCIITDPPFGVDNLSKMSVTNEGKEYARKIANDESTEVAMRIFREVMDVLLPKTSDDCDLYVFTAYQVLKEWLSLVDDIGSRHGFIRKAVLIWEKEGPGMGDLDSWGQGHEFILFLKKGDRKRSAPRRNGVIHVPKIPARELIHPHEKPTALLEILLRHSTNPGDFAVDPFGGSGSLARAGRNIDRNVVCVELDEKNYKLAQEKLVGDEGFPI
jgi:site-specific DNA-methyltransferase (adenine-specific)